MTSGNGGKKGARKSVKGAGPVGRKEIAEAERRAAVAKTPIARKVTRQLADKLRDVHSGNAGKRLARQSSKPAAGASRRRAGGTGRSR